MGVIKEKLFFVLFNLMVKALLDAGYILFVYNVYGYAGYSLNISVYKYGFSWFLTLLVLIFIPSKFNRSSDVVLLLAGTSIIFPLISMYGLSGNSFSAVFASILSYILIWWVVNSKPIVSVKLPLVRNGDKVAVYSSFVFVAFVCVHYAASGVSLNLNLLDVYDYRSFNAEMAGGGIFRYLNPWAYQVVNLFLLAFFLMKKNYRLTYAFFFIQIFLFAASQHKSVLFSAFVVVGIWWLFRKKRSLYIVPVIISSILGLSLILWFFSGDDILPSLFLRRVFFVPAKLCFEYFNFFSDHPKVFWGDTSWMPFVQSPYSVTIPFVIGADLGYPEMSANNGFVSSGFAQAGYFGVLFYSFIVGVVLRFVDRESKKLGASWLGAGLFLLPLLGTWRSSDLSTSMMTHGILLMIILLFLVRMPDAKIVEK